MDESKRTPRRRPMVGAVTVALLATSVLVPRASVEARVVLQSPDIADANDPSISTDGRFVVFGGTVGERRSVFRTDRVTAETIELSPLPEGSRSGDTINAVLSADGCVIVAHTQVAYDLFRDDDRDERWDIYRVVVPECGGRPNAWELVSTSDRTGIARDDVFIESPPSVSGAGAVIAYTHQAPGAADGVSTISVVDITVPVNEPGRVRTVAGMPVEVPNRSFLYAGATQPALSENGRHLAFRADATASEALPGWADGPVLGEYATAQVYVWDRFASDQRRSVHLVSGRDGIPSSAGASTPVISEGGQIVAFVSTDRTLVPAAFAPCSGECPTQIFRFDRDPDGNGILDEPPKAEALTLVSAVGAGVVDVGVPEAGNQASWAPAISADGSQIAFVTDATNLLPSMRSGGGGVADGDLLVAEHHLGQLRRVLDGADATGIPGAHGNPSLSKTGAVIAFDTMATGVITGAERLAGADTRSVATVDVRPRLSLAALDFGTVLLGFESTELYAQVLNSGPSAFEPSIVESSSPNFKITGGTCTRGIIVAAGQSCSVNLTFNPTAPQGFEATLTVGGAGEDAPSASTVLRGAAGEPALAANPGGVDLDPGVVGQAGGRSAVDIENVGFTPTSIRDLAITGAHPDDFVVLSQSCTNRALNPDASCTVEIEFRPTGAGFRSGLLRVSTPSGQYTSAVLGGTGHYDPEFRATSGSARPGAEIGIGGSGFPGGVPVAIGFDDGGAPFTTIVTNVDGTFLSRINIPARTRLGARRLLATAPGGVVAEWGIALEGGIRIAGPPLPGYGLG